MQILKNFTTTLLVSFMAVNVAIAEPKAPKPVMSAASQSPGSLYVTYIASWIGVVSKAFDGLTISQGPGGAAQNIMLVNKGGADFGITNGPQAYAARYGLGWAKGKTYTNFVALHPAYPSSMAIFTRADSNIKTIADLAGKQVGVGQPGSGSDVVSGQLFKHLAIKPARTVKGNWNDMSGMLKDGLVDAIFYLAGHPAGFIQELQIGHELRFITVADKEINSFLKAYPYYGKTMLKNGLYNGIKSEIPTVVQMNLIISDPKLPDDFVTKLLEAVYGSVDKMAAVHPNFANTSFPNVANIPVPFHPAAVRFYEKNKVAMNVPPPPK
jgi:TRAP transporter TAXI family solute receptor